MKILFGENFWGCQDADASCAAVCETRRIEKTFLCAEHRFRIPALYLCPEGIVLDVCIELPAAEIQSFLDRWMMRLQTEALTEEEQEALNRENPFSLHVQMHACLDGVPLSSSMSCSVSWSPPTLEAEEAAVSKPEGPSGEKILLEEYSCSPDCGWRFARYSFYWPENWAGSWKSLVLTLERDPLSVYGPRFETEIGKEGQQISFRHPATEMIHILTVRSLTDARIPEQIPALLRQGREGENNPESNLERIPTCYLELGYTLDPDLSPDLFLLQDTDPGDRLAFRNCRTGAVSVIGGADGPTSVFLAGKPDRSSSENMLSSDCHICFGSLHYEPVSKACWRMSFWVRDPRPVTIEIKGE